MRRLALLAFVVLLLPSGLAAQQTSEQKLEPRFWPAFGLHYGSPLRFSGALGFMMDVGRPRTDVVLLQVEPGQHAIEYTVGYLRMTGSLGSGYSVRASVVRTGDEPWKADPNATYLGVEAQWMALFGVGVRGGLFRRIGGTPGEHQSLGTVGFSIGT